MEFEIKMSDNDGYGHNDWSGCGGDVEVTVTATEGEWKYSRSRCVSHPNVISRWFGATLKSRIERVIETSKRLLGSVCVRHREFVKMEKEMEKELDKYLITVDNRKSTVSDLNQD